MTAEGDDQRLNANHAGAVLPRGARPGVPESLPPGPQDGSPLDRWLVDHPVAVAVGLFLVCFLGLVSVTKIPIQLTPDLSEPAVTLRVLWPGAAPTEVESEVLRPLEEAVNDIPGLKRLEGTANYGEGTLELEFNANVDPDAATVQVANRLASVAALPVAATPPQILPANSSGPPLAVISLTALEGGDADNFLSWVEERIAPEFGRIPGIAQAQVVGGRRSEVHLDLDPYKVARAGLTVSGLGNQLRDNITDQSGGAIEQGKRRLLVRADLPNERAESFGALAVAEDAQGGPVVLSDLGVARIGYRRAASVTYLNQEPGLILLLRRQPGYNVLTATRAVINRLDELTPRLQRAGLEPMLISDQREYIEGALHHVTLNLGLGALLATLILMLLLRSLRASLLVAGAIPACLAATAIGLYVTGRTLNVISIAGVTFAVGMVLDNAIVVTEAVAFWRDRGLGNRAAALKAGGEVGGALVASTLTSLAVFLPLLGWVGQAAELIADLAIAISFALFASLLYSRLVVPSLAASIWRTPRKTAPSASADRAEAAERRVFWIDRRSGRMIFGLGVPALCIGAAAWLMPPLEYLPEGNREIVYAILVPPPGYGVPELRRIAAQHQAAVEPLRTDTPEPTRIKRSFFVGSPGNIFAGVVGWTSAAVPQAVRDMQAIHRNIPGTFSVVRQASLFGRRLGSGRSVELDLQGSDLGDLEHAAAYAMAALRERLPGTQVRPIPDLGAKSLEIRVSPRLERLAKAGISLAEFKSTVGASIDGTFLGEVTLISGDRRDVQLRLRPPGSHAWPDSASLADLAQLPVVGRAGNVFPLGEVAEIASITSPTSVRRIDEQRAISIQVAPPESISLERAIVTTTDIIDEMRTEGYLPGGMEAKLGGDADDLAEAKSSLSMTLLFALMITYLLLAALLENFIAPIAIIVAVPLAACGGIVGFRLASELVAGQTLDIFSSAGLLMLIGLVVNNAILLVDAALNARREGALPRAAVREAVKRRLRPILMTTTTSVVGLAPLVVYQGTGSELYRGIGSIVLGGMLLSTAITLLTTPALLITLRILRANTGERV